MRELDVDPSTWCARRERRCPPAANATPALAQRKVPQASTRPVVLLSFNPSSSHRGASMRAVDLSPGTALAKRIRPRWPPQQADSGTLRLRLSPSLRSAQEPPTDRAAAGRSRSKSGPHTWGICVAAGERGWRPALASMSLTYAQHRGA